MKSKLLYPVLVSFLISILLVAALPAGIPAIASGDAVTNLQLDGLPEKGNPKLDSRLNQFASAETPGEVSFFNPMSGTDVSGAIGTSTNWTLAGSPYIVTGNVMVMDGVTLTIEPGVYVKFAEDIALQINGELIARGTEMNPIIFTTNNTLPAPGDWGYILFNDSSTDATFDIDDNYTGGSILEYCTIEYGGGASVANNGAVRMENAHPFINHCDINNNTASGIHGWTLALDIRITNNDVSNNTASSDGGGIYLSGSGTKTIDNNTVANNTTYSGYHDGGGMYIYGGSNTITNNVVINNTVTGSASSGGGIYAYDSVIDNNDIIGNTTYYYNGGGIYARSSTITNNFIYNNVASSGGGGGIDGSSNIAGNVISNNTASIGGGILSSGTIYDNLIIYNTASSSGGGIRAGGGTSTNNTIGNNNALTGNGGGIFGYGTFVGNSITGNSAFNAGSIYYIYTGSGDRYFESNTIADNTATGPAPNYSMFISNASNAHLDINNSNIFDDTTTYKLWHETAQGLDDLDAEDNWWGTTSDPEIQSLIYDWFDDSNLAIVDYVPYLTEPDITAPPSPPSGLATVTITSTVDLSWDANPEADIIGYKIYYDTSSEHPYEGTGADQGDSPIDVGNVTEFTLTNMATHSFITVTAYDSDGNESWYSIENETVPSGIISGFVFEEDGTTPIAGATVSVYDYDIIIPEADIPIAETTTNASGYYSIAGLSAGDYKVRAIAADHERNFYPDYNLLQMGDPVTVDEGQETSNINFSLSPGGTISGTITAQVGGAPLADVSVFAGPSGMIGSYALAFTDGSGNYTLEGLPYGDYLVTAPVWSKPGSGDNGYIVESWEEKPFGAPADPVTVDTGINPTGIDFTLEQGGTISGHVEDEFSAPIASAILFIWDYASLSGQWTLKGISIARQNGDYETTGLAAGQYAVRAQTAGYVFDWYNETFYKDDATPVTVGAPGSNTPNIDFVLEAGGSISGTVYESDGTTPIPNLHVYAIDSTNDKWVSGVNTDASGNYTISGLASGSYKVRACGTCSGFAYVDEWYDDVASQNMATPVVVTAPDNTGGIDFELETSGMIMGTVFESDGTTPIPNMHIQALNSTNNQWVTAANTNATGNYTLSLPDGSYYITTCTSCCGMNYIDEYYDNAHSTNEATAIIVSGASIITNINFELDIGGTVSGYVLEDGTGDPIAGATVNIIEYDSILGHRLYVGWGQTNSEGYYQSGGLPDGTYGAWVHTSGYASEWYDNTYYPYEADPVEVIAPDNTANISFSLGPDGSISGYVYEADGVTPIANLHVYATDNNTNQWMAGTNTDISGHYVLDGLIDGSYYVRACASCSGQLYIDEWYDDAFSQQTATPVEVIVPADTSGIDFELEAGGTIMGTVYESDGTTPILNLVVRAYDSSDGHYVTSINTNSSGNYTLSGLPEGSYHIQTCAPCNGLNYIDEWYDDVTSQSLATAVVVAAGGVVTNINFSLETGGMVTGVVYDIDGVTPIPNVMVQAYDFTNNEWRPATLTNASGNYTLVGLPDGSYYIRTNAAWGGYDYIDEWYDDVYYQNQATAVNVTAPGVTPGINFNLDTGARISGYILEDGSGDPIQGASVNIIEYSSILGYRLHFGWYQTDGSGYYESAALPDGTYGVFVQAGGYANEWYNNRYYPDEADPVVVTAPTDTENINFSLGPGGSISGYVYEADGVTPIPGMHVNASDNTTGQWVAGTNTDISGHYVLDGIIDGSYYVRTCASCSGLDYIDEWYDDADSQQTATPVEVTIPDDTPGIDFILSTIEVRPTINEAIADGVAWLAAQQNPDGSWGTSYYQVSKTALAVLKLVSHAGDLGISPTDPAYEYYDEIQAGYDYLFANAYTINISPQWAGDPDTRANGIGVYFYSPAYPATSHHPYDIYESAIALMAISANATNYYNTTVNVTGSPVDGWTYAEVAQDIVDYLAWGQTDSGTGQGGWNYLPTDNSGPRSDQSNSGWVTLGLMYAEDFGCIIPTFVTSELDRWIDYIQDDVDGDIEDGGSYYTGLGDGMTPPTNILRTGNLLQQMAFVSDDLSTPRVQNGIDYIVRNWNDTTGRSWQGNPCNYHATYTLMKGLEQLNIETIDSIDWFQELTDEIMSEQSSEGWWPVIGYDNSDRILGTEWALLTLQKEVPETIVDPDLVITDKYEEWVDDGVYVVHFTVENIGNETTGTGFNIGISRDGTPVAAIPVPELGPGAAYDGVSGAIAQTDATDEVMVCADSDNVVVERFENNNCMTNIWPLPDLIVSEKYEEWVVPGESYKVYFTVMNIGDAAAPAGHDVSLHLPPGLIQETKEVPVTLNPAESWSSSFDTVIDLTGGTDVVIVTADFFGEVTELNEINNLRINTVSWPTVPDLTISEINCGWISGLYEVYFTVYNQGNDTAPAGHDASLTVDGLTLETVEIPVALAPDEGYTANFTTLMNITGETDIITVCADANQEITEAVESNNCLTTTFDWPPAPDLSITLIGENWINQNTYTVNAFVRNNGNAAAPAGFDVAMALNGVPADTQEVPVDMIPGQSRLVFFTVQINHGGGTDNITVCADTNQEVPESDESNNCLSAILPGPAPNLIVSEKHEEWVVPGESYNVHFTVLNVGQGIARSGYQVDLNIDIFRITDTLTVPVSLGPGESWSGSFSTVVSLTDNLDTVLVNVDTTGLIYESNEFDNGRANTISWPEMPDLAIVNRYEEWVEDGVYSTYFTIENQGNATVSAGHDAGLTVDGVQIGTVEIPVPLAPGEYYSDNFTNIVTVSGGYDTVMVCTDIYDEIVESNEILNCRTDTIAWPPAPDLQILFKNEQWVDDGIYTVSGFVRNSGNIVVPAGFDVSLNVDGIFITTQEITADILPGRIQIFNFNGTEITLTGESDNITVCVDCYQEVAESREDNNCLTNQWHAEPAITVTRDLPPIAAPGTTFMVTVTFTAPADDFNSIVLHDQAPTGWPVAVDKNDCTPPALTEKLIGVEGLEYTWLGPYNEGESFTAVYEVTVPGGTPEGIYHFPDGWLVYYIGQEEHQAAITWEHEIQISNWIISGITREVNCDILPGATVSLYLNDVLQTETTSDVNGEYELPVGGPGTYTVTVSKAGYRDETQTIEIVEQQLLYELKFTGDSGIIPNEMDGIYFAACMNKYLYGTGDCAFGGVKFAKIMNAYLYGIP